VTGRRRAPHALIVVLAVLAAAACGATGGGLSRPSGDRPVNCPLAGSPLKFTGKFTPGESRSPADNLYVTFVERRPNAEEAAAVLQHCINTTVKTFRIDYEMVATAWFNQEGPLALPDGSATLNYDPKLGTIKTFNMRAGAKPAASVARSGYTVEVRTSKTPAPPHGSLVTLDVTFEKPPDTKDVMAVLVKELTAVVGKQTPKVNTSAFPRTRSVDAQNQRPQIRGASGAFLPAHYDAKTGEIRDQDRQLVGSIK
jgi:hypothetical protein